MLLLPSSTAFEVSGSRIALWPRVAVRREARPADICVQRVATDVNDVSRRRKEACGVCARLALGLLFNFSRPIIYCVCICEPCKCVYMRVRVGGGGVDLPPGWVLVASVYISRYSSKRSRPLQDRLATFTFSNRSVTWHTPNERKGSSPRQAVRPLRVVQTASHGL